MSQKEIKYISHRDVKKKGKKDGREWKWRFGWPLREPKEPAPRIEQTEPCSYELELARTADQDLKFVKTEWEELDKKLLRDFREAKKEYEVLTQREKREHQEHQVAFQEYSEARKEYDKMPAPHLSPGIYRLLMLVFFICEFPINSLVLAIFGRGLIETYIMAGAICGGILWMSHLAGSNLKKAVKNWAAIIAGFAVTGGLLIVISILREKYFEAQKVQEVLGISISSTMLTIIFILVNLFIFVFATWSAYESSYAEPDKHNVAKRRLDAASTAVAKEGSEAVEAKNLLDAAYVKFNNALTLRKKTFELKKSEADASLSTYEALVHGYRDANLSARKSKVMPESFKKDPKEHIKVTSDILTISWDDLDGEAIRS
jgi:hypothetical protein